LLRIAIVNSKSFGMYSSAVSELKALGEVVMVEVPKDINALELAGKLTGVDVVIASVTPRYTAEFFRANRDIKLIVKHGIGVDNIDVNTATEEGVVIARVPGVFERESVAEHTVALILAALRKVVKAHEYVVRGRWGERARFVGMELSGKVVGIIGLGNIGSRVAEILLNGFNAKVLAYDPYVSGEVAERLGIKLVDLDTLLRNSDIISLNCSLTPETYHIINYNAFKLMKRGVIIVNTARGELIDTNDLIKAIEEGVVAAAALDVVEGEPIGEDHPLLKFDNVVITPHIAAYTVEALRGMDEAVVRAIKDFVNGRIPEGVVNREVYERGLRGLS